MPKSEGNPNAETRTGHDADITRRKVWEFAVFGNSDFELLSDFGLRISDF
jgi:hypothetical protein